MKISLTEELALENINSFGERSSMVHDLIIMYLGADLGDKKKECSRTAV